MVSDNTMSDEKFCVNVAAVNKKVKDLFYMKSIKDDDLKALWLLKAVSLIDLTTLAGDDSDSNVIRLCHKAANPIPKEYYKNIFNAENITTAAVCVYPTKVAAAAKTIKSMKMTDKLQIAAVATGFPTGLYPLSTRVSEISYAVKEGATEIDVVIDRSLVLRGDWQTLHDELVEMRNACNGAHMKVILAIGELDTMTNVYDASMVAMRAGCDFIKTSTGKESINATLAVGVVMCRAIRQFYAETGKRIGLKPAGGLKSCQDAINWLILIKEELGDEWLNTKLFRIGASSLLGDIEKWFYNYSTQRIGEASKFAFI